MLKVVNHTEPRMNELKEIKKKYYNFLEKERKINDEHETADDLYFKLKELKKENQKVISDYSTVYGYIIGFECKEKIKAGFKFVTVTKPLWLSAEYQWIKFDKKLGYYINDEGVQMKGVVFKGKFKKEIINDKK